MLLVMMLVKESVSVRYVASDTGKITKGTKGLIRESENLRKKRSEEREREKL